MNINDNNVCINEENDYYINVILMINNNINDN